MPQCFVKCFPPIPPRRRGRDGVVRDTDAAALGYWSGKNNFEWNAIGYGVDSNWAVIA